MSNRPHRRPAKRVTADQIRAAALDASRLAGCDCTPELTLTPDDDGMYRCQVGHDPWCALLQRRSAPWN